MYVTVPPATVLVGIPGDPLEIDGGEPQIAVITMTEVYSYYSLQQNAYT